jgi:hypothetical protein
MSDLRSSFEHELIKENPSITPEEIQAEWGVFIKEYDDWNIRQAEEFARGTNEHQRQTDKAG